MLAEHLLVAGGTDQWRRDVAGSLVSQALEMGMTVVSIDGGSPPDEPTATAPKRSRLVSTELRRAISGSSTYVHGGTSSGNADPLSPLMLRSERSSLGKRVAQIDLDNPAGSVRPNMLFVQAPSSLPPVRGESLSLSLALEVGLPAQLRYLQAVNVTGMEAGLMDGGMANLNSAGARQSTPGEAIPEAWFVVLLLRHHRARLRLACRGVPDIAQAARTETHRESQPFISSFSAAHRLPAFPACPDLPTLALVLEEPEPLLNLLRRERQAWADPDWVSAVKQTGGIEGERAINVAQEALERASSIENLNLSDHYLYGATLRGQLKRLLSHPAMERMLRGPHVSLADLLDGGLTRLLKVNLSGAYRTAALPCSDEDMAQKQYGLYLLWSIWAASQQRTALRVPIPRGQGDGPGMCRPPRPLLLMLHGAGAWFGSGSPLSDPSALADLGSDSSGVAVAATVSGLRHLRAYKAGACEAFGNVVLGPAPVVDLDAPPVVLDLVEAEMGLLRDGMRSLAARVAQQTGDARLHSVSPQVIHAGQALDGDRLLGILRRIDEGTALVITRIPEGRSICTAYVGSSTAVDVRGSWISAS